MTNGPAPCAELKLPFACWRRMDLGTKLKIGSFGLLTSVILLLWFCGGILGAITGIIKDEALFAVASILVPAFGAIYTVISVIAALLDTVF